LNSDPEIFPTPTPRPGVVESGVVLEGSYSYVFYATGVVKVAGSYLIPKAGQFIGFLSDDTLVGLFSDGLHIGEHLIPFPDAYLKLLVKYRLQVAPLELLDSLLPDDDGSGK
jgi:hypothetical protein